MNIFKMTLIDIRRSKFQLLFIILFLFIAGIFMHSGSSGMGGITYLTFATVILSGQPFLSEQRAEAGFLYMLPVTKSERVAGRYCFGMFLMLLMIIESLLLNLMKRWIDGAYIEHILFQIGICFGIGIIVISLQYVLFYAMGKIKSQQFLGIIMMAPGFLMFFMISYLADNIEGTRLLIWILEHPNQMMTGLIAAGIFLWLIGMFVCMGISKKKDFL
ncbi:MAG: ABC-2 transporter permease [Lachnospiraceae bacterium]|nr:ABC-2 transporter permease [Lachnospiraceae bacterium]